MGSCQTAGASLCPKPGFRYFDFTSPSKNGVHGTAIDPWVVTFLWPRFSDTRIRVRNIETAVLDTAKPRRFGTNPFIFCFSPCLSASVVQRFCLWLRLRRAAGGGFPSPPRMFHG